MPPQRSNLVLSSDILNKGCSVISAASRNAAGLELAHPNIESRHEGQAKAYVSMDTVMYDGGGPTPAVAAWHCSLIQLT